MFPFGAEFDGDRVYIYYSQSLIRIQWDSSHTRKIYPEIGNDNLLAVEQMSSWTIVKKGVAS